MDTLGPIHAPDQDDAERPPAPPERTQTLFLWAAATTLGLFVDYLYFQYLLAARLNNALAGSSLLALFLVLIPAGVSQGFLVGGAQWYVLRRYVKNSHWWVVASVLGWTIFYCLDFGYQTLVQPASLTAQSNGSPVSVSSILFISVLAGLTIGLFQWIVLFGWGWETLLWIPVVILAQIASVIVSQLLSSLTVAPVMGWMANGLVLGLALAYLLDRCWPRLLKRGEAVLS